DSPVPRLVEREYANPYLGFTLKLPEGWTLTESMDAQRKNLMVTVESEQIETHTAVRLRATEMPWEYFVPLADGVSGVGEAIKIGDRQGRASPVGNRTAFYATVQAEGVLFEFIGPRSAVEKVISVFAWVPEDEKRRALVSFARVSAPPDLVRQWLADCQSLDVAAFGSVLHETGKTYVYVGSGQRPTGGYRCTISRILRTGDGRLTLFADFMRPALDAVVSQAYSFPYDLVQIDEAGLSARFFGDGNDAPPVVSVLADIAVLGRIYDQSRTIKVFSPAPNTAFKGVVSFSGIVHGTVERLFARLLDPREEVLDKESVAIDVSPNWISFDDTLSISNAQRSGETVHLELYTIDDASGDIIDQVRIPLQVKEIE
ncbi:MAG: protease complex subunit PrcB family protein, partial [Proteobacteria bacterium]|nr:protease complex subunit PrcB family protein [Pseudomonadota bacterium]